MSRYRTKPFEIEAVQFNEMGDHAAVVELKQGTFVEGHQGYSAVNPGDWIIAEPDGEGFYPCDPDTFARKYEQVQ